MGFLILDGLPRSQQDLAFVFGRTESRTKMANTDRILLVLGAGPRLGSGVASKFAARGYRVALAARSLTSGLCEDGTLNIPADLSDPKVVLRVFRATIENFGHPNVVVYNGKLVLALKSHPRLGSSDGTRLIKSGANRLLTPPEDPLSASLETLAASRAVGLDAGYVAAQEALKSFKALPPATPTAFIYTGNTLNQIAIPGVLPFALGKVAAAMVIEYAANAYGKDGYR